MTYQDYLKFKAYFEAELKDKMKVLNSVYRLQGDKSPKVPRLDQCDVPALIVKAEVKSNERS